MPREACPAGFPLWIFIWTRPADVPLRSWKRSSFEWVPQPPLPWTLYPEGRLQRLFPASQGMCYFTMQLFFFFFWFLHIDCLLICVSFFQVCNVCFPPPLQSVCEPQSYRPMHHEDYKEDLRKFRLKSRTWAGERSKRDMYSRLKKLWDSCAHNPSWFYCLDLLKCCPHTWDMAETWRGVLHGICCESVWYWFSNTNLLFTTLISL